MSDSSPKPSWMLEEGEDETKKEELKKENLPTPKSKRNSKKISPPSKSPTNDPSKNSLNFKENHEKENPPWLSKENDSLLKNSNPTLNSYQQINMEPHASTKVKSKSKKTKVEEDSCCCPTDKNLCWFNIFHILSGLTAISSFFINLAYILDTDIGWKQQIIHGYVVVMCLFLLCIELEIQTIVIRLRLLDLWLFRGFFCVFISMLSCKFFPLFLYILSLIPYYYFLILFYYYR